MAATGGAPTQFSRLLRQSRIASFDPAVPQVYTAPPAFAARGDWGLKRPLPSSEYPGALRFVEVQAIDTAQGQTTWKEREKETLFVKRWAEADTRLYLIKPDTNGANHIPPGACGPRPQTTYLTASERYFPSDIPGPIEKAANETDQERQAREYNNKWRAMMKHYATRGAADPSYKGLDFMGEQSNSRAFGYDANQFTTRPQMMKNYNALSEKEFDAFIKEIRQSRNQWKKYFQDKEKVRLMSIIKKKQEREYATAIKARQEAEARGATLNPLPEINPEAAVEHIKLDEVDMLEASRDLDASRDAYRMLEEKTISSTSKVSSKRLPGASQPTTIHPHAGLQYSNPDLIYAKKLAEPIPGRVIHETNNGSNDNRGYKSSKYTDGRSVVIGGRVSYVPLTINMRTNRPPPPIDWSRKEPKRGTGLFRIVDAYRTLQVQVGGGMHPDMLSPSPELGYIRSSLEVVSNDVDGERTSLTETIGSPDYIGKLADDNKTIIYALDSNNTKKKTLPLNSLMRKQEQGKEKKLGRTKITDPARTRRSNPSAETKSMLDSLHLIVDAKNKL